MFKVVYLTGAPASGKSTVTRELQKRIPGLDVFEYGAKLAEMISSRGEGISSHDDLRSKSAVVVTKADIDALDEILIDYVRKNRERRHVIIDSHPVTKESYGFRVTAFSQVALKALNPTEIWVLFASAIETINRIQKASGGRPKPTEFEADLHTQLQASVAATYGVLTGSPVYLFDTGKSQESYISPMIRRLSATT